MGASPNAMQQMMAPPPGPRLAEEGEWVDLPQSEDADVVDTEDGGADILLEKAGDAAPTADTEDFYNNLVESLPAAFLDTLATDLLDKIVRDKQSREKRDKITEEGLKRTGVGRDAPGGAQFQGASKAVHPMLTEAAVDFGARAIKEIFPAQGPAKSYIPGSLTKERTEKATRQTRYFNWLMTTRMVEFRPGLDQNFPQTALNGESYTRYRWNPRLRRPVSNTIQQDLIILPFEAPSMWAAERITYIDDITELEYTNRVRDGIYIDVDIAPPSQAPEKTRSQQARAKQEGKEEEVTNQDGVRRTYETSTYFDDIETNLRDGGLVQDDLSLPYLVFLDETSKQILGVFRNWEKDDPTYERMPWIVNWPFIPWTGAYAAGLGQLIGTLSGAATGALRALLDAGFIANQNTSYVLKGPNVSGQSQSVQVAQQNYVKGGVTGDDIRKLLMPVTPVQPSTTLFNLLQFVVQEGEGFVRTSFENLSENNPNAPVGTTYALIEQGLAVVSAIIGRLHFSMFQSLRILHRITRMYVTDDEIKDEAGEILAYRADFQGPCDVIPVSDPGIPSDAHRFAQIQEVAKRADLKPMLYNQRRVEKMILERLRVQDPDSFLMPLAEPVEMNAANENAAASQGHPLVAYPHQDHISHMRVHLEYLQNPVLGMNPLIFTTFAPVMLKHLSEHMSLWYLGRLYHHVSEALGGQLEHYMEITDEKVKAEVDRTVAAASPRVNQEAQQVFQQMNLMQIIGQVQQQLKQMMPPPPMDPSQATLQKTQMDNASREKIAQSQQQASVQGKTADIQQRMAAANMQLVDSQQARQADAQDRQTQEAGQQQRHASGLQSDAALAALQQMEENARSEQDNETKERMNLEDNETALTISQNEIKAGKNSPLSNGRGIGREK